MHRFRFLTLALVCLCSFPLLAQQNPYFVAYDHSMEEAGTLEISHRSVFGFQRQDLPTYWAPLVEFEYGMTDWWSSAFYLEAASQPHDATVFTGFRWENRFRPLRKEHRINPILYLEYDNTNEASRIKNEVVGHTELSEETLSQSRGVKERELEGKLILSTNARGWNLAENFIVSKNLVEGEAPEFGYALGIYRNLGGGHPSGCRVCREAFTAGLEMYGGLGSSDRFGLSDTSHFLAPTVAWRLNEESSLKVSPGFGLTGISERFLLRVGYSYEIEGFGSRVAHMFRRK
jgi:hypothetical protein